MYCPKCGALNADNAPACAQCGENLEQVRASNQPNQNVNPAYPNRGSVPKPESYLVWSILTTFFCCPPLGVVSLIFSTQVDSRYYMGDIAGATDASNKARIWAIYSAVLMGLVYLAYLIIFIVMAATGSMD